MIFVQGCVSIHLKMVRKRKLAKMMMLCLGFSQTLICFASKGPNLHYPSNEALLGINLCDKAFHLQ